MERALHKRIDWTLIICYLLLVIFGWLNIYASIYSEEVVTIFNFSERYGSQLIWIGSALILAFVILFIISPKVYSAIPWVLYLTILGLLVVVLLFGKEINGSKSWISFGAFSIQPAELSKISTSLVLAALMSRHGFRISKLPDLFTVIIALALPMGLILLEPETGTLIVYAGFIFVLYREGLSGWILIFGLFAIALFILTLVFNPYLTLLISFIIVATATTLFAKRRKGLSILFISILLIILLPKILGPDTPFFEKIRPEYFALIVSAITAAVLLIINLRSRINNLIYVLLFWLFSAFVILSVELIYEKVLMDHQKARIDNLLGIEVDLQGAGYNVNQSKIAIGSGGLTGKGFLQGTQTKFNFVPEQTTDFIFCTVGEEWGFVGSVIVILIFFIMISRIIILSERNHDSFTRIYGYCVASLFFVHVLINIGMTIGLFPVIGIPLPFLSYGGSSLWTFTILLFIFIRLNMERDKIR